MDTIHKTTVPILDYSKGELLQLWTQTSVASSSVVFAVKSPELYQLLKQKELSKEESKKAVVESKADQAQSIHMQQSEKFLSKEHGRILALLPQSHRQQAAREYLPFGI